ncbi:MAG: lipopolysaccharide heptosyltransferase II, partial [Pirellulales bacterium]
MKAPEARLMSQSDHAMIRRLASAGFDGAAIFTVYSQNPLPAALFCYLAEIPLRLAHCRENPYQLLTDWIREPEPHDFVRHEARRHLDLVASVGVESIDDRLRLRVPDLARRRIHRLLDDIRLDTAAPWLTIHPGSTAAARRYPPEKFAEVADGLAKHGFEIVLTGDQSESELIASIQRQMFSPSQSLAGKLSLAELAALIEASPVLISNNTGPVHVAAAVGTPVVDLYALTNPQHTPWLVPHRVLFHDVPCKYCYKSICPEGHHDCLQRVEPEAVVQATLELIAEQSTTEGSGFGRVQGSGFRVQERTSLPNVVQESHDSL